MLEKRFSERLALKPAEAGLTKARMEKDLALHRSVVDEVAKAIREETYPLLTSKEINY